MSYARFYAHQAGTGDLPYYAGERDQFGFGIGSLFQSIAKVAIPAAKYLGRKLLSTGGEVVSDVISGENIRESLKRRGVESLNSMQEDAVKKICQRGSGKRIKRRVGKKKLSVRKKTQKRKRRGRKLF